MPSTLVKDVLYRVSDQIHDLDPQFTRWTERNLVAALNDGQKVIAKYMPHACARVDVIKLAPGTRQSIDALPTARVLPTPAGVVYGNAVLSISRNMGSDGATPGRAIRITDRETLDRAKPTWHSVTGTAVTEYTFDPRTPKIFYVCPAVPAVATPEVPTWVEVAYLADPADIPYAGTTLYAYDGSSTTTISVDDKYTDDLVNYILARAYLKDAEFAGSANLATAHTNLFISSINAQVAALTGVNPNLKSLPLTPNLPAAAS